MARSSILALLFTLAMATGCAGPRNSPSHVSRLDNDTLVVTEATEALNLAISQAVFAIGDPDADPDPESGIRKVPSYHDQSEFRSFERNGETRHYELRTIRFQTPEGVTVETEAVYAFGQVIVRIETTPPSNAVRSAFATKIVSTLRERGIRQNQQAQRTALAD